MMSWVHATPLIWAVGSASAETVTGVSGLAGSAGAVSAADGGAPTSTSESTRAAPSSTASIRFV